MRVKLSSGLDPLRFRDPTPEKVLTPRQDLSDIDSDFAYKTFFGVGSLEFQGSNPEESLDTTCQDMSDIGTDFAYKTFFWVGSLDIRGSNPRESLTKSRHIQHMS